MLDKNKSKSFTIKKNINLHMLTVWKAKDPRVQNVKPETRMVKN